MNEERLPQIILNSIHTVRRKRGETKNKMERRNILRLMVVCGL
jgi:hypothetical protein